MTVGGTLKGKSTGGAFWLLALFGVCAPIADADWLIEETAKARVWVKLTNPRRTMRWSGERDGGGYASGLGTLQVFYDRKIVATYTGEMRSGRMNGEVTATYHKTHQRYLGEIAEWAENGRGAMWYPDGTVKRGLWSDGNFVGEVATTSKSSPQALAGSEKLDAELRRADTQLTEVYERALRAFPAAVQEPLRRAERAWIAFTNKNEAAFRSIGQKRGLSNASLERLGLEEIYARSRELELFSDNSPSDPQDKLLEAVRIADAEMTSIYRQCTGALDPRDREELVQVQRAWIVFRDENTAAMKARASSGKDLLSMRLLTERRAAELRGFYLGAASSVPSSLSQQGTLQDSSQLTAKNIEPEDRKAAEVFEKEASALGKRGLVERSWTAAITSLSDLAPLSSEWTDAAAKVLERWTFIEAALGDEPLHERCLSEVQGVRAALDFSRIAAALRRSDAPAGRRLLQATLARDPTPHRPDYEPIWQALNRTRALLDERFAQVQERLLKAAALGKIGKVADAINEYQSAYERFPDPAIPAAIQKLREESLGL